MSRLTHVMFALHAAVHTLAISSMGDVRGCQLHHFHSAWLLQACVDGVMHM